jgi:hypothetical protein
MSTRKGALVCMLIAGLVAAGCQQSPPPDLIVCDYQPGNPGIKVDLREQGKFALVRLDKVTPEGLEPELSQASLEGGSSLGFQVDQQQLIAFAGPTTMPLDGAGSYRWVATSETPGWEASRKARLDQARTVTFLVLVASPFILTVALIAGWWKGATGTP